MSSLPRRPRKKKKRDSLKNRHILVGITGSVAAYKAVDLVRRLRDLEVSVSVIMTDASCRFITPLSMELAAGETPLIGMFDSPLSHIALSSKADMMLVAPATANTIGRFALGLADDLLSATFMAYRGPVLIAPAMNPRMYSSPAVERNLNCLRDQGVIEVPPAEGMLACGETGKGRMAEVDAIIERVRQIFADKAFAATPLAGDDPEVNDLAGKKVVVTAGPTREYIDPVRYISNRSSGKMGYALARQARRRGADVVLITGPSALRPPHGVRLIRVERAAQMNEAVVAEMPGAFMLIMAAAVADFAPDSEAAGKLPKDQVASIALRRNPDILAGVCSSPQRPQIVVGFAAETGGTTERAREKLAGKGADFIVYNNVQETGAGFDVDTNKVTVIGGELEKPLPLMSKDDVAAAVIDIVLKS